MKEKIIILNTDPDIVEYRYNIEGWVGKDGRFYGKDESLARRCNSTHTKCECGTIIGKGWSKCDLCSQRKLRMTYNNLPHVEYVGDPVFSYDSGDFFYSEDGIIDYLIDNELTEIDLYTSEPQFYQNLDIDIWADVMPGDCDDIPKELSDLIDNFNESLRKLAPASYTQNLRERTSYKLEENEA